MIFCLDCSLILCTLASVKSFFAACCLSRIVPIIISPHFKILLITFRTQMGQTSFSLILGFLLGVGNTHSWQNCLTHKTLWAALKRLIISQAHDSHQQMSEPSCHGNLEVSLTVLCLSTLKQDGVNGGRGRYKWKVESWSSKTHKDVNIPNNNLLFLSSAAVFLHFECHFICHHTLRPVLPPSIECLWEYCVKITKMLWTIVCIMLLLYYPGLPLQIQWV